MRIKNLVGNIYNVNYEFLYIKPFWLDSVVIKWTICSNESGKEIRLGSYYEKAAAEKMLSLLSFYNMAYDGLSKEFQPIGQIFSEVEILEQMYFEASRRIDKAREVYKNEKAGD